MIIGFFYMTRVLGVSPSAAVGILTFSIVFITIPASIGFYRGLKSRYSTSGNRNLLPSNNGQLGVPLSLVGVSSALSLGLGAWAMYQIRTGNRDEAYTLLAAAALISIPSTIYLILALKARGNSLTESTSSLRKPKLFGLATTLVLHANIGLSLLLYGTYLIFSRDALIAGSLCILLGLTAFATLHARVSAVEEFFRK